MTVSRRVFSSSAPEMSDHRWTFEDGLEADEIMLSPGLLKSSPRDVFFVSCGSCLMSLKSPLVHV